MKEGKTQVQVQVVHYSLVKVASSRSRIVARFFSSRDESERFFSREYQSITTTPRSTPRAAFVRADLHRRSLHLLATALGLMARVEMPMTCPAVPV